ncbi:PIN/TRAM domain-containing protein [Candidatus Magnetomonas plexicatena]|uniref:PIN/TRAM domain-containing protein n=1 Tax=Candidatus Magnetomonas plexicatena TaxID=2552947 RepID=UPI004032C722
MAVFFRLFIFVIFVVGGYNLMKPYGFTYEGVFVGLILGIMVLGSEYFLKKLKIGKIVGGITGLVLGITLGRLIIFPIRNLVGAYPVISYMIEAFTGYTGLLIGLMRGENLSASSIIRLFRGQGLEENLKILDTSSIIDGRIADVCDTGFLDGIFIVPQFILQELQHIADSSDSMKRSRGRRGLDVLHRIQKLSTITVRLIEEDFPKIKEVDSKLVALAKMMNAKIITTDFNLNKVAQLHDVSVLNINELANALKPVVLPGETMKVFIIKEGKESNQGVAYTEDGTMVVVENARKMIGKNIEVAVTSVLQTTAGRMIFSKPANEY